MPFERRCAITLRPTSLHNYLCVRAIRRGNLAEVKRFLDEGGDVETVGGRFHSTLLTEASRFRVAKVIDLLLEKGAVANVSGGGFWTPLHYACDGPGRGSAAIAAAKLVATLIENHAEVDATDFRGRTPLHLACLRGSAAVALALLEAGRHTYLKMREGGTKNCVAVYCSACWVYCNTQANLRSSRYGDYSKKNLL